MQISTPGGSPGRDAELLERPEQPEVAGGPLPWGNTLWQENSLQTFKGAPDGLALSSSQTDAQSVGR